MHAAIVDGMVVYVVEEIDENLDHALHALTRFGFASGGEWYAKEASEKLSSMVDQLPQTVANNTIADHPPVDRATSDVLFDIHRKLSEYQSGKLTRLGGGWVGQDASTAAGEAKAAISLIIGQLDEKAIRSQVLVPAVRRFDS